MTHSKSVTLVYVLVEMMDKRRCVRSSLYAGVRERAEAVSVGDEEEMACRDDKADGSVGSGGER